MTEEEPTDDRSDGGQRPGRGAERSTRGRNGDAPDGSSSRGRPGGLDPSDVERLFDILDRTVGEGAALDERQRDTLLSVLESALVTPTPLGAEETEELFSVIESAVLDPTDPELVDEVLAVLETAVTNPMRFDGTESGGLLSVFESALVDPDDPPPGVEDVFSLLDSAIADPTGDGEPRGVFSLLDSAGLDFSGRHGRDDADPEDPASLFDGDEFDAPDTDFEGLSDPFRFARIAAAATQRSTRYSIRSGIRLGTGMVRAAYTAESVADLVDEARTIAFTEMERMGLDVPDYETGDGDGEYEWYPEDRIQTREVLRDRGSQLLEMSADIDHDEAVHPAFGRILDDLAADEARLLRLLATEGPQPSLDVRDVGFVRLSSDLVAAGLTMIGTEAGLRHEDRTPVYLNNLQRLGLVWFSDEPVENIKRYQILQAQPNVEAAVEEAKRPKLVRRSVHLTPFGVEFCRVCFPFEVSAARPAGAFEVPEFDGE